MILFDGELNDFCREYFVGDKNEIVNLLEIYLQMKRMEENIFESFLLFDEVRLKVYGENIPLVVLLNNFGLKNLEKLIEQDALSFVLWNSLVTYLVDDVPGVDPLQSGNLNSEAHSDPEKSLSLGFKWKVNPLKTYEQRRLIKKLRDKYHVPAGDLASSSVSTVKSAYNSRKLVNYDLNPDHSSYRDLDSIGRKKLCECAAEVQQYTYLIDQGLTSYYQLNFIDLFNDTLRKLRRGSIIRDGASLITQVENIPDLRKLYHQLNTPFDDLVRMRESSKARKLRNWLEQCSEKSDASEMTREYVDAIANAKGFFQTVQGKIVKNIAMSCVGGGIGLGINGVGGALVGASAAKILEPVADFGLDLLDEFVLSGLMKGWSPKLFFDDIAKLERRSKDK